MAYTKHLLVAGLCSVLAVQTASAQDGAATATYTTRDMTYRGQNYDVFDSTKYGAGRMNQYRQYMNHEYAFPPKPRNQWEIGVHAGLWNVLGDVPTLLFWEKANSQENFGSYGIGGHLRKALGYTFSIRADYTYGVGKGLQWQPASQNAAEANLRTTAITSLYNGDYFYNYRTEAHNVNLDLVANLTNILFHKAKPRVNVYAFGGISAIAFGTRVNALDANYKAYNYSTNSALASYFAAAPGSNAGFVYDNRGKIQDAIAGIMDGTYETDALANTRRNNNIIERKTTMLAATGGLGFQFRLSRTVNISLEDRVTLPFGNSADLMDGVKYATVPGGGVSISPDNDLINYANIGLNLNIGSRRSRVEPLYWMNPLDHAYNELADPRHMRLPDPVLTDSDGDGIIDQFDKCPGTPAGVAVDAHGCPMDTDGDGVPDYLDKQLITPTECQPVDADGVGKCPCNCTGQTAAASSCGNIGAGSLSFSSGSSRISPAMQSQLSSLAAQMKANPTCKVVITGNGSGSKMMQQRSWDRVNSVIEYMSERAGVDRGRFIFQYGGAGSDNSVMFRSANAGEEGPSNTPPPFPNMRRN